ncbi:hypothetical protein [Flavobacterium sp. LB3R33]|uniref:hypothetical protein n=1 Tax=Flavobacterium sp. LB3R33 TaxID=3401721 RepID=UPI003AAD5A51
MKRTFLTITFLILLVGYIVFIHKQSEFIAGEYRYYTLYEEYQAREKYVDYSAKAYETDIYNIKTLKNKLIREIEILDKYRVKLNSYNDSIKLISNTVPDYNRYTSNLKELKLKIDNQKEIILNYENELNELDKYISKLERDILSIKMYKSDIANVNSVFKSVDSTAKKYNSSLFFIQGIAELKGLKLEKEILKEKEIERQNLLAKIERERELEYQQTETTTEYSLNKYVSDYSRYESTKSYDLPTTYYSTPSVPSISSYPSSFYSTNPNHVQVDGYYKSNGTYVEPHVRTAPNNTIKDNFSTSPNLNPYTGSIGTIKY